HRPLRTRLCATDTICPSLLLHSAPLPLFFFFNSTSPTEIYTLSLHDALPISGGVFFQQSLLAHCQLRFILRDNRINQFRQCSPFLHHGRDACRDDFPLRLRHLKTIRRAAVYVSIEILQKAGMFGQKIFTKINAQKNVAKKAMLISIRTDIQLMYGFFKMLLICKHSINAFAE